MGLAKRVFDPETKKHIPYRNDKSLTGTVTVATVNWKKLDQEEAESYPLVWQMYLRAEHKSFFTLGS